MNTMKKIKKNTYSIIFAFIKIIGVYIFLFTLDHSAYNNKYYVVSKYHELLSGEFDLMQKKKYPDVLYLMLKKYSLLPNGLRIINKSTISAFSDTTDAADKTINSFSGDSFAYINKYHFASNAQDSVYNKLYLLRKSMYSEIDYYVFKKYSLLENGVVNKNMENIGIANSALVAGDAVNNSIKMFFLMFLKHFNAVILFVGNLLMFCVAIGYSDWPLIYISIGYAGLQLLFLMLSPLIYLYYIIAMCFQSCTTWYIVIWLIFSLCGYFAFYALLYIILFSWKDLKKIVKNILSAYNIL